jgi:hypothetical protein
MDHLLVFTSRTTVDRRSARRAGRTQTTASRCVVGIKISPVHRLWMRARCGDHDGADTHHLIGERARAERCRREATQRWRVHPTVGVPAGEGLKMTPRAHFLSSHWVAHRPAALLARSLQHELKRAREKKKWALGFGRRRRCRFCSARFHVWPLDEDGRLTTCGPIGAAQVGKQNPGPGPRRGQRAVHAVTREIGHGLILFPGRFQL